MIISAKSLSGEYVSIEILENSIRIEEEFEQKYKDLYIDHKLHQFLSVKLLECAVFYYNEKGDEEVKSEWSFLVNTHKLALCLERYKDSWMSFSLNPHPYIMEMFEELNEEEKIDHIYRNMSRNPVAIEFFVNNPDKICWKDNMLFNERVGEIIHLYKCKNKKILWDQIIKYSPNAYEFVCSHSGYNQFDWDYFLTNKYIKPEWVQYVIDKKPSVWGECLDSEGVAHGEFDYIFRLTKEHWQNLSKMPIMIPLLKKYTDKICWKELCENPCSDAIDILRENRDKVVVSSLCNNHTIYAISFLEEITPDLNINKKSWSALCRNPFAIDIIQRYKHSIKYTELAKNSNERAIEMIKIHLSIPTLSKHYREGILKKLVENDRAGWLVLELFSKGEYSNLDYVYTAKILTKPYIFCPDI